MLCIGDALYVGGNDAAVCDARYLVLTVKGTGPREFGADTIIM